MLNYCSVSDLSNVIRQNIYKIPSSVDLVVGIPRSGVLAANIISLHLNLKSCDLESFLNDYPLRHGKRHTRFNEIKIPSEANHILIVDDSIASGAAMSKVKEEVIQKYPNKKITYAAVYAVSTSYELVDIYFDIVEMPRVFEWNLMHRSFLEYCCVDIDGVLCVDPTREDNDDGDSYKKFLENVMPLSLPSSPIGHLVTSRLEKYRKETESWLSKNGIIFGQLHMLNLSSAVERRRLKCHGLFKAEVYKSLPKVKLFIESDRNQAIEIANLSGKPCLSFSTQELFFPTETTKKSKWHKLKNKFLLYLSKKKLIKT